MCRSGDKRHGWIWLNRYKHTVRFMGPSLFRIFILHTLHVRNHKVSARAYFVESGFGYGSDSA